MNAKVTVMTPEWRDATGFLIARAVREFNVPVENAAWR
jgi:hypothetical protein